MSELTPFGRSTLSSTPAVLSPMLRVLRHSRTARLPTRGSPHAAGYDLYSAESKIIPAGGRALIDTQISIAVPEGTYGRIAPRSGLALKFGLTTGARVIDADYRGIVHVLLFNLGANEIEICVGDRIAQLILEQVATPSVEEITVLAGANLPASHFAHP